jgi:hypothetical protein
MSRALVLVFALLAAACGSSPLAPSQTAAPAVETPRAVAPLAQFSGEIAPSTATRSVDADWLHCHMLPLSLAGTAIRSDLTWTGSPWLTLSLSRAPYPTPETIVSERPQIVGLITDGRRSLTLTASLSRGYSHWLCVSNLDRATSAEYTLTVAAQ